MEVHGKFDVKRFYKTLAAIISQRENVEVKVRVIEEPQEEHVEEKESA